MPGSTCAALVLGAFLLLAGMRQRLRCLLPRTWRHYARPLWWLLVVPALLTMLALASGCAPAAPLPLQPVPRPQRPAFVAFADGDFLPCSAAARRRLLQRHAQLVWYLRELETALDAWESQTQGARHDD